MEISCFYGLKVNALIPTRIFLITSYTIYAIPTFLLNLAVLVAIWKTPSLHKPSQILLANLALLDFLVGTVADPYLVFSNLAIINGWSYLLCHSWIILATFSYCLVFISLYTLAVISVDRFLAIKLKFTYRTVVTNKRVISVLLCGWFVHGGLYITIVVLLFNNISTKVFVFPITLYLSVLLSTITLCYSMAFYHLKRLSSQVSSSNTNEPTTPNAPSSFDVTKYRRSLHTMVIVLSAIFIFYLPHLISVILESMFKEVTILSHLARVGETFLAINSFVNPILYLWRMGDLRKAVKDTAKRLCL